ncbi:hypothetical protein BLX06_28045 [Bacillus cereus]|uniref:Uncharacterized protein n=1 Tax=Bacillus cereus TaxID=1396 RepID=A0A9X6GDC3_BACCE|nr:hypothetical protein BLX06_28045 [Bacillus cereus]
MLNLFTLFVHVVHCVLTIVLNVYNFVVDVVMRLLDSYNQLLIKVLEIKSVAVAILGEVCTPLCFAKTS